ncbi:rab guanyl-nucleotide exchange factor [Wolfiporia cocos MD-104 SS10]|uniref:Rab guanyl-nucleotide exchange factor n=1 Tax=Wolfiporia cocos (strain MD-104) TaxID=742152 RepID=A0A2H3K1L2_WOLCO|nr:rab guanyl-nucleotide exchange factor [Wolfiporia cocos MD-104 SS10]
MICFGYSVSDYALFSLETSRMAEITPPVTSAASSSGISNMSMGAFSGLGGYMTLGLGAKAKPSVVSIRDGEAFAAKENTGLFLGSDGKLTRETRVDWPAPPEELAFVKPYIFSVLPAGSVPMSHIEVSSGTPSSQTPFVPSPVLEIRSSLSLAPVQTLPFPPAAADAAGAGSQHSVRLLTNSSSVKTPLFLVTTPTDRTAAAASGSSIWCFRMKSWSEQVDELVEGGMYADALALLDTIEEAVLPDKDRRIRLVRALHAVSQFRAGRFDDAVNTFIELDINPAKVVALYPESVAGRLSVPQDDWIPLFGGPAKPAPATPSDEQQREGSITSPTTTTAPQRPPSPRGSVRTSLRGLESIISPISSSFPRDEETASVIGRRRERPKDDFHRSIETLMRYLSDRRPKVSGALEALNITSAQSHQMPNLSEASTEELFGLPNVPLSSLMPDQLVRFAQIVDTALFKSYLLVRPGLLAPLCRVGNWCEVSEVEEVLRAREKFSELIYLYNGKKMHNKALGLLRELSAQETDVRDKLMASVNYLQRLGPGYIDQVFENSRWVLEQDSEIGLEIFTSEETDLPRQPVADFLEDFDPSICARYLEYLIEEREESSSLFHNRLAEVYLGMTVSAKKQKDEDRYRGAYAKLIRFIDTTDHYHIDRLYGLLPSEDLFEAKAILLGRLGRHDNALELYVYRLQDYIKAEEYCKRIYRPNSDTSNVFLTLLRIYLHPTNQSSKTATSDLLRPALDLISRHSPRLDPNETLRLLPPLVTAQDVQAFLREALRAPILDTQIVREVAKTRRDEVSRRLMHLQTRRVKVTDSRICPQCHKRIGYSVIAVHAPRGEVTHYQCREAFSRKLKETRA